MLDIGEPVAEKELHAGHPRRSIPTDMTFAPWIAPDGWPLRSFAWPAQDRTRGSLLFLAGRGDFVEKYLEALRHWHEGGWHLAGFDWRGQGGSGRLLVDRAVCHLDSFDPPLDDLDAFVADWKGRTPAPHVIVAHSMGAHLTLRLLAERHAQVDAAALMAPMVAIAARGLPNAAVRALSGTAVAAGLGRRRIWGKDIGNYGGRMTSCPDRLEDKLWWKAVQPETASGAPSWGWLCAAAHSIARMQRVLPQLPNHVPLLILASELDPVIDVAALKRIAARLPQSALRLFPGRSHELLREADARRLEVFAAIDSFLPGG
ncbi:alpha/beta hydrolase [Sphingosinicella sp. LHD-64]|uniref:alpha/beta hydrolase n=1 Tax=Sphingosinicella sp. LHD-64 TaxID=3072139 RepID=UPI00280C4CB3|nr:alpha/beta hydrolase [Sphingosinicella sp. LHD-64]MDQ8755339.1 alpha/beta hydrolase [Sphingosinicella sp. LHD-64]